MTHRIVSKGNSHCKVLRHPPTPWWDGGRPRHGVLLWAFGHCINWYVQTGVHAPALQVRTDSCQDGQAQQLVAQKYLERPLLAFQRKFDLRQWVLVSSWEPLTVWFYRDCYLRFCAEDYKPSNFDNIFCHLSNNSIAKKSRKFKTGGHRPARSAGGARNSAATGLGLLGVAGEQLHRLFCVPDDRTDPLTTSHGDGLGNRVHLERARLVVSRG